MRLRPTSGEEGMALLLAMIFMIAMAIALAGFVSRVQNQVNQVETYVDFEEALQGAEAAVAVARAELEGSDSGDGALDGLVGVDPAYDLTGPMPFFGDTAVTPRTLASNPETEFFAVTYQWATDGIDNNGDGTIDDSGESRYASIYGFGRTPTAVRRIELVFEGGNVNIWQNAIFAGSGQSGNLINGNVSIHGSVHLLGDSLADGDVALDMSGNSGIYNNYSGLNAGLRNRVPALPTTTVAGETVETLEAKLRVKNGIVAVSGSTTIGTTQQTGNGYKETMDGVFVSDGWGGNKTNSDGVPGPVHSDNSYTEEYDLGGSIPFPDYANDGGRDHLAYYLELGSAGQGLQHVYNGDMTIAANKHFYWNATTGSEVNNKNPGSNGMPAFNNLQTLINNNEFFVWFDASSNRMVINGRVPIDGDLALERGSGNDKTINYSGRGTMLTFDASGSNNHGDVSVETNLYTTNLDGSTANSFPHNNHLGLMANRDLTIGSNAQLEVMGGFYAQGTAAVNKQTIIMGTIVGDSFDMGRNVPDIYQVPELANAWLPQDRMIGADPVLVLSPVSWRELGVR